MFNNLKLTVMKTQDLLVSYERKEKVAKIFSFVSGIGVVSGIIFGILYLIFKNPLFDTIAVYGLTIFILPVVLLQFFMTAGIYYGVGLGWIYVFFYLFLFPFADMWFFSGVNAIYHIIPDYHVMDAITRSDFTEKSWLYIGGIYFFVIVLGLIWRMGKNITKNVAFQKIRGF